MMNNPFKPEMVRWPEKNKKKRIASAREKYWGLQFLFSWGRDHSPHSKDGATAPFCFVSMAELECSCGLPQLSHLYHLLHRFFCLLRKRLIWITGYHNNTVEVWTARSCHQQNRVPFLKPGPGSRLWCTEQVQAGRHSPWSTCKFSGAKSCNGLVLERTDSKVFPW